MTQTLTVAKKKEKNVSDNEDLDRIRLPDNYKQMSMGELVVWLDDLKEQDPVINEVWKAIGAKVSRESKGEGSNETVTRTVSFVDSEGVKHSLIGERVGDGEISIKLSTEKPNSEADTSTANIYVVRDFIKDFLKYTDKAVMSDGSKASSKADNFKEVINDVEGSSPAEVSKQEEAVPVPVIVKTSQGRRIQPKIEGEVKKVEEGKDSASINPDLAKFLDKRGISDPQEILEMSGMISLKGKDEELVERVKGELGLDNNDEVIFPEITKVELDKNTNGARDGWIYLTEDQKESRLRLTDFVKLIS